MKTIRFLAKEITELQLEQNISDCFILDNLKNTEGVKII